MYLHKFWPMPPTPVACGQNCSNCFPKYLEKFPWKTPEIKYNKMLVFKIYVWVSHTHTLCFICDNKQTPTKPTSICILRWVLKMLNSIKNMSSDSWNTLGTLDTPFLLNATQRYCFIAEIKISSVLNTGPECSKMDSSNFKERFLERNSCDLKEIINYFASTNNFFPSIYR